MKKKGPVAILKYFVLAALVGACLTVNAQERKTETRQARFRIDSVFTRHDSLLVILGGGRASGLQTGLFVKCFSAFRVVDGVELVPKEIGYGTVIYAGDDRAICAVTLNNTKQLIEEGDHVAVNISLPVLSYESLLYDISVNGIQFIAVDKKPFFNSRNFMSSINKEWEDAIKNKMVGDLHAAYEIVKDRKNLPASIISIMELGRYRGKNALQVWKNATIEDLNSFLLYAKTYPAKYVGNLYRLSESFAAWVISNSPYSADEVKVALMPWYKNKTEFSNRIKEYKTSILAEGHCASYGEEAIELNDNAKTAEADQLMQFAFAVADELKDTVGSASLFLDQAQILLDREKYKEAVAVCDKVIATALLCRDSKNKIFGECRKLELAAMIKKGFCQYKMSLYKEGINSLAEAEDMAKKYEPFLTKEDHSFYLQRVFEYMGWINYTSGDYTKAISNFKKAIDINDIINTYDSKNKNAAYYKRIGNVYKEQGNYKQAIDEYAKASVIYESLSDIKNKLLVQVDLGEVYYYLADYDKSLRYLDEGKQGLLAMNDYAAAGHASSFSGSAYYRLGKYDSAILSHKASVELSKIAGKNSAQAFSWNQLGELYLLSGHKKEALAAYDSSISYYSNIPDKASIADNYNSKGKVYLNDENFKKAVENFEKANGNTNKTTVEALYNLSSAWMMIDSAKAGKYLLQCKKLSAETGNQIYKFYSFIDLARLACRNNKFRDVAIYYDSVAVMAKMFGTGLYEARRLDLQAYWYTYRLELDSAITNYQRSVTIFDTVDITSAAWERISLVQTMIAKGEFKEAETVLAKAIQLADSASAMLALGSSYNTKSFLYALLGEFKKGMEANDRATAIYNETGNDFSQAEALVNKGSLYKVTGEFKKSIDAYLQADSIYRAEKTEEMRGMVLNNIGVTYYSQGDYQKSIDYFTRSAKYNKPGLVDENYLLNRSNIAECYFYLKNNKQAEKILLEIFPLAQAKKADRIGASIAITLGEIYLDQKQFAKAGPYLETGRQLSFKNQEKEAMMSVLIDLAKLKTANGDETEAEKLLQQAIGISKEYDVSSGSWVAFYESGLLYYRQKKYDQAIDDFKNAVEIIERSSNNIYGGDDARKIFRNDPRKVDLYGKLVVVLAESGRTAEAWTYANRSNMTGIKELMGNMANNTGDAAKDAALEQARSLSQKKETLAKKEAELKAQPQTEQTRSQLQSIGQEKDIAETEFIKYTENLLSKDPDLRDNFYDNVNPVDFENYKGALPPDMVVLLYVINDNKLLIFSLTNEKLAITPINLKEDISKTIGQYRTLLKMPGKTTGTGAIHVRSTIEGEEDNVDVSKLSFTDVSQKMYELLISPVLSLIGDKKKLCIIPNGDLGNIPFQAMGRLSPDGHFNFLIEDYMIFYTSRMKIFDAAPPVSSDMSSVAVFGVPDKTLKYTESEARAIGNIMQVPDGVYIEERATEQQAKLSLTQKKYVHFATHGYLDYTDYNASYLKFLPSADTSGGNNGKLTIDEIYRLNIAGCDLVNLSACETAVNREKTKGWKISPANSLLRKRVRSVLATLWKVDDESTSIIEAEFYTQLRAGKEKVEALRLAQEKLSKDDRHKHPYYWAAFVLLGDWR